jgi:hypothetical protein
MLCQQWHAQVVDRNLRRHLEGAVQDFVDGDGSALTPPAPLSGYRPGQFGHLPTAFLLPDALQFRI